MNNKIISALTGQHHTAMINLLSQKTKDGIETPITKGHKAAFYAVFLRPSKMHTALIRLQTIMVGCMGHPSGWPVPLAGSLNPIQSATQRLRPKDGGLLPFKGKTA